MKATGCDGENGAEALAVANQSPDLTLLRGEVAELICAASHAYTQHVLDRAPSVPAMERLRKASIAATNALSLLSPYLMGEGFEEAPAKGAAARRSHPAVQSPPAAEGDAQ